MPVLVLQALIVVLPVALLRWLRPTDGREPAADFNQFPLILRALGGLRQYPALLLVSLVLQLLLGLTVVGALGLGWGAATWIEWWPVAVCFAVVTPALLPAVLAPAVLKPLRRGRMLFGTLLQEAAAGTLRAFPISLGVAGLVAAPVGCAGVLADGLRTTDAGGTAFVLVCAVVASLQLLSALCLAPILRVDRRVSFRAALRGALDLSHGYRTRLLGVNMLFLWLACALLAWMGGFATFGIVDFLIALLLMAVLWATHAVTLVIIYHRLRAVKHGDEATRIADIFK